MKKTEQTLTIVAGALILMIWAFYNNYPLVDSDTGTYIISGFKHQVPIDRPITYGTFLFLSSLAHTLWLSVFAQCLLLSFLIIRFLKNLFPDIPNNALLGIILLVSTGTIAGWYASDVMPDIFTAILCLAILNFLFNKYDTKGHRIFYGFTILGAVLMHNSYVAIFLLLTVCIYIWYFIKKRPAFLKPALLLFPAISFVSILTFCSLNYFSGKGFTVSKGTPVFMVARLSESGVLTKYLNDVCGEKNYKLCAYKDKLPSAASTFIWDANGPLMQTGGWDANIPEYKRLLKDFFSRPKYVFRYGYTCIEGTFRELALLHIDESYEAPWMKFDAGTSPYENIKAFVPNEINEQANTKFNQRVIKFSFLDHLYDLVFFISSLIVLFCWQIGNKKVFGTIYLMTFLFIIINAFIVVTFANINTRLNSRIIWMIPFLNFAFIYDIVQRRLLPLIRKKETETTSIH